MRAEALGSVFEVTLIAEADAVAVVDEFAERLLQDGHGLLAFGMGVEVVFECVEAISPALAARSQPCVELCQWCHAGPVEASVGIDAHIDETGLAQHLHRPKPSFAVLSLRYNGGRGDSSRATRRISARLRPRPWR